MINCEEYKQIFDNLGIATITKSSYDETVKIALVINDMLDNEEIGLEWYFSLVFELGKAVGWYD